MGGSCGLTLPTHLSSHGFMPAGTPPGRQLTASAPRPEKGLGKPPLCAQQQLDWTLYLRMCTLGRKTPSSRSCCANEWSGPPLSQALRKHSLSYCFFFFFNCPETCSLTLVLDFPGLALPGPGDKYPLALSPAYHLIPHWSDPVC